VEVTKNLDLLVRALQKLPPRELQMLFLAKVLGAIQEEICTLFFVRQSNISYRLERATGRIKLFVCFSKLLSETQLRKVLLDLQLSDYAVQIVLGIVKTTSQTATAEALGAGQGNVRNVFTLALNKLKGALATNPGQEQLALALEMLLTVEKNFNQLRAIRTQKRWEWKVRGSNYPKDTPRVTDAV